MTDQKISEYFYLSEISKSITAIRKKIKNIPKKEDIERAKALAKNVLDKVRRRFGPYSPLSWFRNLQLNFLVGGAWNSEHLYGGAADIELATVSNYDLAEWIYKNCEYDQLILEHYDGKNPWSGWVHVAYREGKNRKQALAFDGKTYKPLKFN
jgi:hypothetical protein